MIGDSGRMQRGCEEFFCPVTIILACLPNLRAIYLMEITCHSCTIFLFAHFPLYIAAIVSILLVIGWLVLYRKKKAGKKLGGENEETAVPLFAEGDDVIESEAATPPPPAKLPVIKKQAVDDLHDQSLFEEVIRLRMEAADCHRANSDTPAVYVSGSGESKIQLAIVCKWRAGFTAGRVEWARSFEMVTYRNYETGTCVPVFIVIGVGGHPQRPELISFIPLQAVRSNVLTKAQLENYSGGGMIAGSGMGQDKSSANVETR